MATMGLKISTQADRCSASDSLVLLLLITTFTFGSNVENKFIQLANLQEENIEMKKIRKKNT